MQIDDFLKLLEASRFATTLRDSIWMFPIIESIHVISFTLVVGTIAIIDLRLLGLASTQRSFQRMASDILKWTWVAFALAVATGLTMFTTNAGVYYHNPFFRAKMMLLVLAGVNMVIFEVTAARTIRQWDQARSAPRAGKAVAVLSLTIWIAVIFMGRMIGFTTHPGKVLPPQPGVDFDNFLQPSSNGNSNGTSNAPPLNPVKK
jgi:cytochrome bd-type quinol oxidase subunit 1